MQNENQKNLFKGKFYSSHFHGESEQLQFSYTENNDYNDQYIPKTLAWNIYFI